MVKLREGGSIPSKSKKEIVKPVKLSKKKEALIVKQTKAKLAILAALPPAPYVNIMPAPKLATMTPAELCNYVADKFPRINAVPQFALCNPAVSVSEAIYTELFPLAGLNRKDIVTNQRTAMDLYVEQLKQNFTATVISCANLANGDLTLFSLIAVAVRKTPVKHNGQLSAPSFELKANKGPKKIGVRIKKMEFAKGYMLYYGPGDYDKATWKSQQGGCFQTIKDLTEGQKINVIAVAIGKDGEGDWSNPQFIIVPFN